jgi:hypothetical protein
VLAKGVRRLRVTDNRVVQMQIKIGPDAVATGLNALGPALVAHNLIVRPRNWGITAVHFTDPTEIGDVHIVDNVIEDPAGEGGVAVGTDGDAARIKSLKRIAIRGNTIRGRWANQGAPAGNAQAIGVLVRAAEFSEDIQLIGNTISVDAAGTTATIGIKVDVPSRPTTMRSLLIAHNALRNHALGGLVVLGDTGTSGLVVSGNTLENTGLLLARGRIEDGIVESNVATGRGAGLELRTARSGDRIGPLLLRGNILKNSQGDCLMLNAAVANTSIEADVVGNSCRVTQGTPHVGVREIGPGTNFDTRYLDNDVRANGLSLTNPRAIVRDNRV